MITSIKRFFDRLRYNVVMDANDNSVTFNKGLFKNLGGLDMKRTFIMFKVNNGYGFTNEHQLEKEKTSLNEVQYNEKYKCIGFETLTPSVNRIFYDYGIDANIKVRLAVEIRKAGNGMKYYYIVPPKRTLNGKGN